MTKSIQELEAIEKVAREDLSAAKEDLRRARVLASGFAVGNVVMTDKGKEYKVAEVDCKWSDHAWLRAYPRKKNGEWSKSRRNISGRYCVVVQP